MTRPNTEQLIGVLLPPSTPRRAPLPAPLATLPFAVDPSGPSHLLFDVARLDRSGRLSSRKLVRRLGWRAGQRLDIATAGRCIVVTASTTSRNVVTARGEVSVPSAARALSGIGPDEQVLLTADPSRVLLVVHPAATVTRLLAGLHTGMHGGRHVG